MCLALPMKILDLDGLMANCELNGVRRKVNLFLIADQQPKRGDFVLVHVGYALQKVSRENAEGNLQTYIDLTEGSD